MRRVLLLHLIGHLLPELHHRYVMYIEAAAAASLRAQHQQHNTTAEYIALFTATYENLEAINLQEHNVLQGSSLLSRSTHIYSFPPS
jgi:hypothetical protein